MAYTIKTWDKAEIIINDQQGENLISLIESGVEMVKIKGDLYKTSAIAQVKKGGVLQGANSLRIGSGDNERREQKGSGYEKFQKMKQQMGL